MPALPVSRASLHTALERSEYKNLSLWVCLLRADILTVLFASPAVPADAWFAIARFAESAVVSNKAEWKASPALYVPFTLDHARALIKAGALADAKRALGTLRSVSSAKHTWEFFKLLAVIEARQGKLVVRSRESTSVRSKRGVA